MKEKPVAIIIEDDEFIADLAALKMADYFEIRKVARADYARELLAKEHIDVLFVDINLPDQNGLDFMESIQQEPYFENLTIVILTNNDTGDNQERALALGAKAFYVKSTANYADIAKEVVALVGK